MRVCSHCNGTGKWKLPVMEKCNESDEGAFNMLGTWIKITNEKTLSCPTCDGKGYISYKPPENLFIGD